MAISNSRKRVFVDFILLENEKLEEERYDYWLCGNETSLSPEPVVVPEGHTLGVSKKVYDSYRSGLDSACADIVVYTIDPKGNSSVIAIKRLNPPFQGKWWMVGGALHAYRPIERFLREKAQSELGVRPQIEAILGVYRTCAGDALASTLQPCYVGYVAWNAISSIVVDRAHYSWRLISLDQLDEIPLSEQHYYPMHVFRRALETTPSNVEV